MNMNGIDVSSNNGTINWSQVKAAGYDFAFIKASEGYPDNSSADITMRNYLIQNVQAANQAGVICGAYHYSSATDTDTGANAKYSSVETQAKFFINNVKLAGGFNKIKLPLCIDIEINDNDPNDPYRDMPSAQLTAIAKAFALEISKAGFVPCLYLNNDFLANRYIMSEFGDLNMWYARYGISQTDVINQCPNAMFWQQSKTGTVNGISGHVDLDVALTSIYNNASSDGAIYYCAQTKTGSSVYIDYCEKKLYVPTGYSNTQILNSLRPLPGNYAQYILNTNSLEVYDNVNHVSRQYFAIVRY